MGYRFSVTDEELRDKYYDGVWEDPDWPHEHGVNCNAKCLRMDPLPDYYSGVMRGSLGEMETTEIVVLADGLERHTTDPDVRNHNRFDQLVKCIDWLRYWAMTAYNVRCG